MIIRRYPSGIFGPECVVVVRGERLSDMSTPGKMDCVFRTGHRTMWGLSYVGIEPGRIATHRELLDDPPQETG